MWAATALRACVPTRSMLNERNYLLRPRASTGSENSDTGHNECCSIIITGQIPARLDRFLDEW